MNKAFCPNLGPEGKQFLVSYKYFMETLWKKHVPNIIDFSISDQKMC